MADDEFQRRRVLQLAGIGATGGSALSGTAAGALPETDASDWETETDGDADVTVVSDSALDLRVYKCSTAIARKSLGTVTGPLGLSFDYTVEAEGWYELPKARVYEDGEQVLEVDTDRKESGTVTGSVDREIEVDGDVEVEFLIVPSNPCGNGDHANTYFEPRNIQIESGPATRFEARPSIPEPGKEVTFDASGTEGDVDAYQWSFGDGSSATGEVVTHTFDSAAVYDVTLTAERPDGESTTTEGIPVGEEDDRGDAGVAAAFEHSPETPIAGQQITFDATASESGFPDGSIGRYEWQFGVESDDPDVETGRWTKYAFEEPGEYTVKLTVVDESPYVEPQTEDDSTTPITDVTTATVSVNEAGETDGFTVETTNPTTTDEVRFQSSAAKEFEPPLPPGNEDWTTIEWTFGDGASTAGAEVVHQYEYPGTYEATMTEEGGPTFSKEITVESAPIKVEFVERELRGSKLLPKMPFEERFTATVRTADGVDVDEVRFSFLGNEATDETGFEGEYEASFSLEELSPPSERLEVTAVGTNADGEEVRHEWDRSLPVYRIPDWLEFILDVVGDSGIERLDEKEREAEEFDDLPPRVRFTYRPLENLGVGFELPEDVLGGDDNNVDEEEQEQSYDLSFDAGAWYSPLRGQGSVSASGGVSADMMAVAVSTELSAEGVIDSDLDLERALVSFTTEVDVTPRTVGPVPISVPIPGRNKTIGIEPTLSIDGAGDFYFNSDLSFDDGTLYPGIGFEIAVGIVIDLPVIPKGELRTALDGYVEGEIDIGTDSYDPAATFTLGGEIVFDPASFLPNAVINRTIYEIDLVGGGVDSTIAVSPTDVRLEPPSIGGEQPLPSIDTVDAPGTDAVTATPLDGAATEDAPRQTDRLSDRPYSDRNPTIATASDGRQAVLWARQDGSKQAEDGRDLVVRWHDGGDWSDTTALTDDGIDHDQPALAAAGDRLLAVWRAIDPDDVDGNVATPQDLNSALAAGELAYSVYDGNEWSDPTTLTDSDRLQQRPTIAADGDGWLVGWQSLDPETNESSVEAAQVAGVDDVTRLDSRSNAGNPAVGARNDDRVDFAYVALDGSGTTSEVVHQRLADGSVDAEDSYNAAGAITLDVGDDRLVWVTNPESDPTITEIRAGNRTDLSLREDVQQVRDLSLQSDWNSYLLSYRANLEDGPNRDIVYRLDRGDGWIYDRRAAGSIEEELTVENADQTFVDASTMMTTYSARDPGLDPVADVFATTQSFTPAYGIIEPPSTTESVGTNAADGVAGEETTVEYTIANRGDADGSEPVELTIEAAETTTRTLDSQAAGGTATVSETVTIPQDGRIVATISVDEPTLGTEPTTIETIAATPALRFGDVDVARPAEDSATAALECYNGGGARAQDVPLAIEDDDGNRIATATVDAVDPGATATVEVDFDPTALDPTSRQTLLLDPDDTLPDRAVARRTEPVQLLAPDVAIEDVRYRKDADLSFVEATVVNSGVGAADIEYQVANADGEELGTVATALPPATDGTALSRRVRVAVPDLAVGTTVSHEVAIDGTDDTADGLTREDSVETILPGTYFTATRYAADDGTVARDGLRNAVSDWRGDRIETDLLIEIIDAWQSGDPVV